jgi:cytochrome c peroxidase
MSREASVAVGLAALALSACEGGSESRSTATAIPAQLSAQANAGKALFFDTSLSASGRQSCGTCHVRARAFTADPATDSGLSMPTLHKLVQFYVTRDINNNTGNNPYAVPAGRGGNPYLAMGTFFTAADGTPDLYQYNDLPVLWDGNVNSGETPYTLPAVAGGTAPTLTTAEIDDLVAFLCTLTDGFDPKTPAAYNAPAQCAPGAE